MKSARDPVRLLHARAGAPAAVRRALSAGRADLPDTAALGRLAAKLPFVVPPGGPPAPAPPHPPGAPSPPVANPPVANPPVVNPPVVNPPVANPPVASPPVASPPVAPPPVAPATLAAPAASATAAVVAAPSVVPGVLAGAVLGVLVSGAVAVWGPPPAAPSTERPLPVASAAPGPEGERSGAPGVSLVSSPVRPSSPLQAPGASARSDRNQGETDPSPRSPSLVGTTEAVPAGAGEGPRVEGAEAAGIGGAAGGPVPVEEGESALVRRAQEALASSPARALKLADEHLARHPGGMFAQEREVIAISALVALGRASEARRRASAFLSAHPRSAYRPRVEALVPQAKSER